MRGCDLCSFSETGGLEIVSGLRLCRECILEDPTRALAQRGIAPLEGTDPFRKPLGRAFHASLFLDAHDLGFSLQCLREGLHHKVIKLFSAEFQVGDPIFDDAIYLRTDDPGKAGALLANQGVQSALLALLGRSPSNDDRANTVLLDRRRIEVRLERVTIHGAGDEQALKLETTALALHAVAAAAAVTPGRG